MWSGERARRGSAAGELLGAVVTGGAACAALAVASIGLSKTMRQPRASEAALHHTGRTTGRHLTTPVLAEPVDDGFVLPLPFGADTEWRRNVSAAGACSLDWHGRTYALDRPQIIALRDAARAFPYLPCELFARDGVQQCLLLRQATLRLKPVTTMRAITPATQPERIAVVA
jgi:hypothetical protein